eukprot:scaffold250006_cov36-Tisochrysis_lutea.AAC.1
MPVTDVFACQLLNVACAFRISNRGAHDSKRSQLTHTDRIQCGQGECVRECVLDLVLGPHSYRPSAPVQAGRPQTADDAMESRSALESRSG